MAATPRAKQLKDGTVVWRQPFRLVPGGGVTYETFTARVEAEKFGRLVDEIGGQAARDVRTASTTSGPNIPTLLTWLETHLTTVSASGTPGTVGEYRRMARRTFLPMLGMLPIDAITRADVVAWVVAQRATETERSIRARAKAVAARENDQAVKVPAPKFYSPKSITNAKGLLSDALKAAVAADMLPRNVAAGVPMPSDAETPEMVILTANEFTTLYGEIPDYWKPFVATLYASGMRWGEATALTPGDLDLDAVTPVLRITRAWKKGDTDATKYLGSPKTRRGRRTVSLPAQLVPILRELCEGKSAGDLLFTAKEGGVISPQHFRERVWHPAVVRSGIGKTPRVHDLRHSHASQMIAAGMNLLQLQYRLGHESLKTTGDTYGHLMPDAHTAGATFATISLAGALPEIEPGEDEPKRIGA